MEIARKMNIASINGLRKGLKSVKEIAFVARFFGVASDVTAEPTADGSAQRKFTGEFQAISADGKEHAAPVLYLPTPVDAHLAAAIKDAGSKPVKFAFDLFVEPDAGHVLGYAIKACPLIAPSSVNTLSDLKTQLPDVPLKAAPGTLPGNVPAEPSATDVVVAADSTTSAQATSAKTKTKK